MLDYWKQLKLQFDNGDVSFKLIFINVALFAVAQVVNLFFFNHSAVKVEDYFGAVAGFDQLMKQPWGLFTYSFFHGSFLHLLLNMLMLYFVGNLFLRYFRSENLLIFYLFGSISGGLFYMVFSGVLNYGAVLLGASAAIYALFFSLVAYIPKTRVQLAFINLPLRLDYLGYGLIAFDAIMILAGKNVGGHVSHIGGALFGYLYMKPFERGNDFLGKFFNGILSTAPRVKRSESRSNQPPKDDYLFNAQKVKKQKDIDAILDKISRSGYDSLSRSEKDFLFNEGKK